MSDVKPARPNRVYSPIEDDLVILDPDESARTDLPEPADGGNVEPDTQRRLDEAIAAARRRRERAELGLDAEEDA